MTKAASALPIRPLTPEDWPALRAMDELAFGFGPGQQHDELLELEKELFPWERSLGSFDGDLLVGAVAAFKLRMSVPGAVRPMAGVTWVSVRPSHRRRGLTRAHMERQLRDLYEAGEEAVAGLWSSEPGIYGRYGYGLASNSLGVTIPRPSPLRDIPTDSTLRIRLMPGTEAADVIAPLYEEVAASPAARPGMLARDSKLWWRRHLSDHDRGEGSVLTCLIVERGSDVRGFALYRMRGKWDTFRANGTVEVREVHAAEPAALAMLYDFLLDVALTAETNIWNIPVDDPLLDWLADRRIAQPRLRDTLYLRLLDVGRALAERTYATDIDLVLEVTDEVCPWNHGTWRLQGGPDGASCARTEAAAELAVPVRELGSAYVGAPRFGTSLRAGRIDERKPGAVGAAMVAFGHEVAPFCPYVF